jgi:phenylacetate-coenzyme A ligase PaaK-like adenylate-forming protein
VNTEAISALLKGPLYAADSASRRATLLQVLRDVTAHHMQSCAPYGRFCAGQSVVPDEIDSLEAIPYLPTAIFKDALLLSIPPEKVFREIRSSATSSGRPSRIGLDKDNNRRWTLSLQRMLLDRIGDRRVRTLILDEPSVLDPETVIGARASMTRSLLFSSSTVDTCLTVEQGVLGLDADKLILSLQDFGDGTDAMMFGFTFILYINVVKALLDAGRRFDLPNLKIVHAGGWKKLEALRVTPEKLIEDCCACFGVPPENVIDIYGFSEQGGLLYPTCEAGVRHTPAWSEVISRDPLTLEPLPFGKEGLMQFLTPIQTSYPGHSVITEDVGVVLGRDTCSCGRKGTMFKVLGRSQTATEERGCGDIMAEMFA